MSDLLLNLVDTNYLVWTILVFLTYYFTLHHYVYWITKGVSHVTPIPFFGNAFKYVFCIKPSFEIEQEIYNKFEGEPYCGLYEFFRPSLMIRDPTLIEQIMIKDFSIWMDRDNHVDTRVDPLSNHLVNLTGTKWRNLRKKLTPTFSSGKLKIMLQQLVKCSDSMVKTFEKNSGKPIEVRLKMAGFAMDVIATCAFGLDINVLENPDSVFVKIANSVFQPSKLGKLRRYLRNHLPFFIYKTFGLKSIPKEMEDYFIKVIKNSIKQREENNLQRNDFIQLMMELKEQEQAQTNPENKIFDDITLTSNAFVFLLAGFETTASTISYFLYEISKRPDIQDKLYAEAQHVLKQHNREITWDSLKQLTYLDQCISETLRKHPIVTSVRRRNVKSYKFSNSSLELPRGSSVTIPIYAIQHDPLYFPNPEEFEPERFSEDMQKLVKNTLLSFGEGPRTCIGMKFALFEMKVAITKLITYFKFKVNPKTIDPLVYSPISLFLTPIGGLWLDIMPREKNE